MHSDIEQCSRKASIFCFAMRNACWFNFQCIVKSVAWSPFLVFLVFLPSGLTILHSRCVSRAHSFEHPTSNSLILTLLDLSLSLVDSGKKHQARLWKYKSSNITKIRVEKKTNEIQYGKTFDACNVHLDIFGTSNFFTTWSLGVSRPTTACKRWTSMNKQVNGSKITCSVLCYWRETHCSRSTHQLMCWHQRSMLIGI